MFGLGLMDTTNIRNKLTENINDAIEGVTGRWTIFS